MDVAKEGIGSVLPAHLVRQAGCWLRRGRLLHLAHAWRRTTVGEPRGYYAAYETRAQTWASMHERNNFPVGSNQELISDLFLQH